MFFGPRKVILKLSDFNLIESIPKDVQRLCADAFSVERDVFNYDVLVAMYFILSEEFAFRRRHVIGCIDSDVFIVHIADFAENVIGGIGPVVNWRADQRGMSRLFKFIEEYVCDTSSEH